MTEPTPKPGRRMTAAAKIKLNELIASGSSVADAMRTLSSDPTSFEESVSSTPPPVVPVMRSRWRGDTTDWSGVVEKVERLSELDRGRAMFGASRHAYQFAPPAMERDVIAIEKKWKVELPPGLRAFYTQVGNGGAGPGYGLAALAALTRFKPATAYPGAHRRNRAARDIDVALRGLHEHSNT